TLAVYISFFSFSCIYTAIPAIYTLSLHDALPICILNRVQLFLFHVRHRRLLDLSRARLANREPTTEAGNCSWRGGAPSVWTAVRSEEHTSELQSPDHLVCRLLLEKKKKKNDNRIY